MADYELAAEGLEIQLEGKHAGTYSTPAAPQGYVAAWITEVDGERRGATRFPIDEAAIADAINKFSASTTVQDVYSSCRACSCMPSLISRVAKVKVGPVPTGRLRVICRGNHDAPANGILKLRSRAQFFVP